MGRIEQDQALPKDRPPQMPPQENNYAPGVGSPNQPISPALLADPNLGIRMQAVRDMARSASGRMPTPMIPPGETASGGEALPTKPWNPHQGQQPQAAPQSIPTMQAFARQNFPNLARSKYITPAEMKLVQQAYQMEMGRLKAVGGMGGQGGGPGGPPKEPGNLPAMVGHAALHPELYTPEALKRLTEAAELIYGKDGKKGKKKGAGGKQKAAPEAKNGESLAGDAAGAGQSPGKSLGPNPEDSFPGLKGTQMGPGYKKDVLQGVMMDNEYEGTQGLISMFKKKPVEAWFKARAMERGVLPQVNPKLSATLKNFLDKFRPDPRQVLQAFDEGIIDRQQAKDLLEFLLTDEEQAAMGVGNETGGPLQAGQAPQSAAQNPMMQGTNAGGGGL